MNITMIKNKVYSVLMNEWDEEITGIFIAQGKKWILLKDNQNDFLVDGYRLIQKRNVQEIFREENEIFKEQIFDLKYTKSVPLEIDFNLDDAYFLFQQLQASKKLIHFDADDETEIVVGEIVAVTKDGFEIKTLAADAEWIEKLTCNFSEISSVAIGNDYLNSLELFLSSK